MARGRGPGATPSSLVDRHPMIGDSQHDPELKVYLEQGARDRAREAAGARQGEESGDERDDDQDSKRPTSQAGR